MSKILRELFHYFFEIAFGQALENAKSELEANPISDEWRGWHTNSDNLRPPVAEIFTSVSSVMSVGSDTKINKARLAGHLYHQVPLELTGKARAFIYGHKVNEAINLPSYLRRVAKSSVSGLVKNSGRTKKAISQGNVTNGEVNIILENMIKLWLYEAELLSAKLKSYLSSHNNFSRDTLAYDVLSILTERKIDGRALGLSQDLSVDSIDTTSLHTVIDMKSGDIDPRDKVAVAGYALAFESVEKMPADYGCVEYISFTQRNPLPRIRCEIFPISNSLRVTFVEMRNRKLLELAKK